MVQHQFFKCINDKPLIEWLHLCLEVVNMVMSKQVMPDVLTNGYALIHTRSYQVQ